MQTQVVAVAEDIACAAIAPMRFRLAFHRRSTAARTVTGEAALEQGSKRPARLQEGGCGLRVFGWFLLLG